MGTRKGNNRETETKTQPRPRGPASGQMRGVVPPMPGTEIDWQQRALEAERALREPHTLPPVQPALTTPPVTHRRVAQPALQLVSPATPPSQLVGRSRRVDVEPETDSKAVVVTVQAGHKRFIERACEAVHLPQSDFYRRAALSQAEIILGEKAPALEPYRSGPRNRNGGR